jgi:hypothetical protein
MKERRKDKKERRRFLEEWIKHAENFCTQKGSKRFYSLVNAIRKGFRTHIKHGKSSDNEWAEIRVLFSWLTGRFRNVNEKGNRTTS